jgi:organic radical activating enzyme
MTWCYYKFAWSTTQLLEGKTRSCHRVEPDFIDPTNYQDFHNTPSKIADRKLMLENKWPDNACQYCKKIEDVGGMSDRIMANKFEKPKYGLPPEVVVDPTAIYTSPKMLEIYFNNLCNMGCIYCNLQLSSVWEAESRKYNLDKENLDILDEQRKNYPLMLEEHWKWLKKYGTSLGVYRILGGEPFYQPETVTNIEFFENNPMPDLVFSLFSNLKVNSTKLKFLCDKLQSLKDRKHVKNIELILSLDCWGPEQEYIRYGLSLQQWEENFTKLLTDYDFSLSIHSTMTNLSIKTSHELQQRILEWSKIRFVSHSTNFCVGPEYYAPGIFPNTFFDKDFKNILKTVQTDEEQKMIYGYLDTINNSAYEPERIIQLKTEMSALDSRRGTDWKKVFPWLDEFR